MLKGVLPVIVLATLAPADTYGYAIVRQLREAGLPGVGDASVYGTLQRLSDAGFVASYLSESESGPARRYYTLTKQGKASLAQGCAVWESVQTTVNAVLATSKGAS